MEAVKSAGRARLKTARKAQEQEEQLAANAPRQWSSAFDFVFDSATDPVQCGNFVTGGRGVLVVIPGFSSWAALKPEHVQKWKEAAMLSAPEDGSAPSALSLVFKWPCGSVKWSSMEANVEAAAAWVDAHEAAKEAAVSLTRLLRYLVSLGGKVVVAAHSLGARVALQALSNDLAAPKIDGLLILGAAVNNHALHNHEGTPAEFPFSRLMSKVNQLVLAHSHKDPALSGFWTQCEQGRCSGRAPPPALGQTGPLLQQEDADGLDEWADRVMLLDVSPDATTHDPTDYLLTPGVGYNLRKTLFPNATM